MKSRFLLIAVVLFTILSCCQRKGNKASYNLDFENIVNEYPTGWENYGNLDYVVHLDSVETKSGNYSAVIEYTGDNPDYKIWAFPIPEIYEGKQITLSGYIKTEDITDGFAGLWMRIDPQVGLENMLSEKLIGTTEWKKYEITLDMNPSKTVQTVVGGILVGKGKMWLDDLSISIDGKDIYSLKPVEITRISSNQVYPADKDTAEFKYSSRIIFHDLDEKQINNLELLGKLWGFLKYHHPSIAQGNYNWDFELFRILPEYLQVKNTKERDDLLLRWINKLGKITSTHILSETSEEVLLKPDHSWIEGSGMSDKLTKKIKEVYHNRNQGEQYYIKMTLVGNPVFLNENSYSLMPYPDAGYRLLALYRLWNMTHYFFPYKYLCDKPWNQVLKEYIPLFISAKDELAYEQTMNLLIAELNDTHAQLAYADKIQESKGIRYVPIKVKFIENKLVMVGFRKPEIKKEVTLKVGDIITHIDGESIDDIVNRVKKHYPASNETVRLRDISNNMFRTNNESIDVQYISSNQMKSETIKTDEIDSLFLYKEAIRPCYKFMNNDIGYVTLASIEEEDVSHIKKKIMNTKGIIIDIRNYPNIFVPYSLGRYFVSTYTDFNKPSTSNINHPGEILMGLSQGIFPLEKTYQGKLIVLINEETQSQAEFTAMAFRAGSNTIIIGSTTAGADGDYSKISLPGALYTGFSGLGEYYPDGTETQRIGIIPDVWVEPTIEGIKKGKDEVLDKAIEIIRKGY